MGGITVTEYPQETDLTTLRRVKIELGLDLTTTTNDELLLSLITEASQAIEDYCHRDFSRATVKEITAGNGRVRLMLSRTPVAEIESVVRDDSTIASTNYSIEDAESGALYRETGWYWTVSEDARFLVPYSQASADHPEYEVTYTGGYLLPNDDYIATSLSILTSTASINDSTGALPLVAAGDRITLKGWSSASNNNKTVTVVSRTASKIVVSSTTLAAEASTDVARQLVVRQEPYGLPHDLERACVQTIKAWWYQRTHDPAVAGKQVGDLSLQYSVTAMAETLPPQVKRLLAPYRRVV